MIPDFFQLVNSENQIIKIMIRDSKAGKIREIKGTRYLDFGQIRDKLTQHFCCVNSFGIKYEGKGIPDECYVENVNTDGLEISHYPEPNEEIEVMMIGIYGKKAFKLNPQNTWNYEANKIARKLGIEVENLGLKSGDHMEIIHRNKTCADVIRKTNLIKLTYQKYTSQFTFENTGRIEGLINFKIANAYGIRNLYFYEIDTMEDILITAILIGLIKSEKEAL
jgi:hypothetical protein